MRKRLLAAAIVLLGAAASGYTGSTPIEQRQSVTGTTPSADNPGTDQSPAIIKGTVTTTLPSDQLAQQHAGDQIKTANDHALTVATEWLAGLTAVLAVVAIVQVLMFLQQLKLARIQLKLTEQAVHDSGVAAESAKESADVLPKIERAYLFVDVSVTGEVVIEDNRLYEIHIGVTITNHGKTPAILRRLRAYPEWRNAPPQELVENPRAEHRIPAGLVVGSNKDYLYRIKQKINGDRWRALRDVVERVYIVGLVDYDDVLSEHRTTGFCWNSYPEGGDVLFQISEGTNLNYFT